MFLIETVGSELLLSVRIQFWTSHGFNQSPKNRTYSPKVEWAKECFKIEDEALLTSFYISLPLPCNLHQRDKCSGHMP